MAKKRIPKEIKEIVRNYAKRLAEKEKLPIEKVIIFGSQAKGKTRRFSDIDVCIISPKFKDVMQTLEFLWQKRKDEEVKAGLEPVGFSNKDFQEGSSLIQEIKRSGVEIVR